jgi:hypothetical protein
MMFWLIAAAILVAVAALAWWSSGRQRRGINESAIPSNDDQQKRSGMYGDLGTGN